MEFQVENIKNFYVVGISARVTPATAAESIGGLWQRWFREGLEDKIRDKVSDDKYNIYSNYEGDHTKPYTCFLGCKVDSIDRVPDRLQAIEIVGGKYAIFNIQGKLPDVVLQTWRKIYGMNEFERRYSADFDVYGPEAADPDKAKLKTFVSIK